MLKNSVAIWQPGRVNIENSIISDNDGGVTTDKCGYIKNSIISNNNGGFSIVSPNAGGANITTSQFIGNAGGISSEGTINVYGGQFIDNNAYAISASRVCINDTPD